jgi:hypothetical protein
MQELTTPLLRFQFLTEAITKFLIRRRSSELHRRADLQANTSFSEKHTVSIFSPEEGGSMTLRRASNWKQRSVGHGAGMNMLSKNTVPYLGEILGFHGDVAPWSLAQINWRFKGTYYFHQQNCTEAVSISETLVNSYYNTRRNITEGSRHFYPILFSVEATVVTLVCSHYTYVGLELSWRHTTCRKLLFPSNCITAMNILEHYTGEWLQRWSGISEGRVTPCLQTDFCLRFDKVEACSRYPTDTVALLLNNSSNESLDIQWLLRGKKETCARIKVKLPKNGHHVQHRYKEKVKVPLSPHRAQVTCVRRKANEDFTSSRRWLRRWLSPGLLRLVVWYKFWRKFQRRSLPPPSEGSHKVLHAATTHKTVTFRNVKFPQNRGTAQDKWIWITI